ncbi:MAG: serine protease [Bacteroidetes bacterium]|nr:MAG: serine protease [Bacteroidota bacterium]
MRSLVVALVLAAACSGPNRTVVVPPSPNTDERAFVGELIRRTTRIDAYCPEQGGDISWWGSGVWIGPGREKGKWILATAKHVVERDDCTYKLEEAYLGTPLEARVVLRSTTHDVAVIETDVEADIWTRPSHPYVGMRVWVVGYPVQVLTGEGSLQVTSGRLAVSYGTPELFRVTAEAFFGSSGGPVFDDEARLVGLLVALSRGAGQMEWYAVPATEVFRLYNAATVR